jgi:hypothetical protein
MSSGVLTTLTEGSRLGMLSLVSITPFHGECDMHKSILSSAVVLALALAGCESSSPIRTGDTRAKTPATGSAGGANSSNVNAALERCDRPLGTLALVEDTSQPWYGELTGQHHLGSTVPLLRLMVQQSNCFVVVERGRAMASVKQERELEKEGELRKNSKFGKGQLVAADYSMTPSITFSQSDGGGVVGAIAGRVSGAVGAVIGNTKSRQAATILTLTDNRSGVQVAAAEGSASRTDINVFGGLFGGGAGAGVGGYTKTAQGKVVAGAFLDSYSQLVKAVKNYRPQEATGPDGMGTGGALEVK